MGGRGGSKPRRQLTTGSCTSPTTVMGRWPCLGLKYAYAHLLHLLRRQQPLRRRHQALCRLPHQDIHRGLAQLRGLALDRGVDSKTHYRGANRGSEGALCCLCLARPRRPARESSPGGEPPSDRRPSGYCCKVFEIVGGTPTSRKRHFDRDSAGKTVNSNFSVWRITVSLAPTPICSPTKTLCRWCTLPMG